MGGPCESNSHVGEPPEHVRRMDRQARLTEAFILRCQGTYYVVSGLWAVADRRGFERVTGPKTDYWLVRTVGLLAATIGTTLLAGTRRAPPSSETTMLGLAAGASFVAVDLVYVAQGRISRVYLGDATAHGLLAAFALSNRRRRRATPA